MKITKDLLMSQLMYNLPVKYSENITLYPITMRDILTFQVLNSSITVRKDSIFRDKNIIKMSYYEFLIYATANPDLGKEYDIENLQYYFSYCYQLLLLCCVNADIKFDEETLYLYINDELITPEKFDDLRRIIIIQNDIDFDIDEFINYDTEKSLKEAQEKENKNNKDKTSIEDYIDSMVIALGISENDIMNMTIRKFWRYVKRYNLHEAYTISKTSECSGFVSFKEPIKHWMCSIDVEDKYAHLKSDESVIKGKIANANE